MEKLVTKDGQQLVEITLKDVTDVRTLREIPKDAQTARLVTVNGRRMIEFTRKVSLDRKAIEDRLAANQERLDQLKEQVDADAALLAQFEEK